MDYNELADALNGTGKYAPPVHLMAAPLMPPCKCLACCIRQGMSREAIEAEGWRELHELAQPRIKRDRSNPVAFHQTTNQTERNKP